MNFCCFTQRVFGTLLVVVLIKFFSDKAPVNPKSAFSDLCSREIILHLLFGLPSNYGVQMGGREQ